MAPARRLVGVASVLAARRESPPRHDHEPGEGAVGECEYPPGGAIEQQTLDPIADEALGVDRRASLIAQPSLEGGQRTGHPEPGLRGDHGDGPEMDRAEPPAVDPVPGQPVSGDDQPESADHEGDHPQVRQHHDVREQQIG
jgi:hypothetical protein